MTIFKVTFFHSTQMSNSYFRIVRYEDMTDHVLRTTKDIFKFLELPIQPETYKFLKEHCDPLVWKKAHVVPQVMNFTGNFFFLNPDFKLFFAFHFMDS